jgi:hypothetical protein
MDSSCWEKAEGVLRQEYDEAQVVHFGKKTTGADRKARYEKRYGKPSPSK